jgi:hypothetical protein
MATTSMTEEIQQLQKRLGQLQVQAEDVLRQKLKEARAVVTEPEFQLSEVTGRPTATQIKVVKGFAPITDDQLEVMITFLMQKEGQEGGFSLLLENAVLAFACGELYSPLSQ